MNNNFTPTSIPQFYRCAHHGRYSTQMQRPASLEDQERICRDFATQQGWLIESEAEVIRRIFQLYADGYNKDEIFLKLNVEKRSPQNSRSAKTAR
jgi:hypothetical protein